MNRRHFLSMLGIGAASLAAAPLLKLVPAREYIFAPYVPIYSTPTIKLADMYEAFATIQRHDLTPSTIFMNPRDYQSLRNRLNVVS